MLFLKCSVEDLDHLAESSFFLGTADTYAASNGKLLLNYFLLIYSVYC